MCNPPARTIDPRTHESTHAGLGAYRRLGFRKTGFLQIFVKRPPKTCPLDDPTMPIQFMKQDLSHAVALDSVRNVTSVAQGSTSMPVFGAISVANVSRTATGLTTTMVFSNGSAAETERAVGRGHAVWLGFLPGLSYFKPALPKRPVDRCHRDDCFCQFLPEQFDAAALAVLQHVEALASDHPATKTILRPVSASDGLVEVRFCHTRAISHRETRSAASHTGRCVRILSLSLSSQVSPVVTASGGSLITVVNWRMTPTHVTIFVDNTTGWLADFSTATLGSSNTVVPRSVVGTKIALGPLEVAVADAVVLR